LIYFFPRRLDDVGLLDIDPIKLNPAWMNKRVGEHKIAKRLEILLLLESFINDRAIIR